MADFFEIDFLDVESGKSGDAICLRYRIGDRTYIHVVDGGFQDTGQKVVDHIRKYYDNPTYIDHVVVSHNDGDHAGGLRTVLEQFEVGALWMLRPWMYAGELIDRFARYTNVDNLRKELRANYANLVALEEIAERRGIPIYEPFQGQHIGAFIAMAPTRAHFLDMVVESDKTPTPAQDLTKSLSELLTERFQKALTFVKGLWGEEYFPANDTSAENEMCPVQYAKLCGKKILLTADTGRKGLQQVIDYAPVIGLTLPGVDRFQVPHHGSRRNVTSAILDQLLGPILPSQLENGTFTAVISSAKADEAHPRKAVLRALYHRGAHIATTEGKSVCTSHNAPDREGWSPVVPPAYPDEQEE